MMSDGSGDNLTRAPGIRFRLPALLAAMTLLALLAALAGPHFRRQSAVAQQSLAVYWVIVLVMTIAGFVWRWRRTTTPNPLMGVAHWRVTLVRRRWWLDPLMRITVFAILAVLLAEEAAYVVRLTDRFADGPISRWMAIVLRGTIKGFVLGLVLSFSLLRRPAFICDRGVWSLGRETFWSKLKAWEWLPHRPGVLRLGEVNASKVRGDVFLAVPSEIRTVVEEYVREKTELTIPDPKSRQIDFDRIVVDEEENEFI
jgi:hypothetical protein